MQQTTVRMSSEVDASVEDAALNAKYVLADTSKSAKKYTIFASHCS